MAKTKYISTNLFLVLNVS